MHRTVCQHTMKRHQDAAATWRLFTPGDWEGNGPQNFITFPLCLALMIVQDDYLVPWNHPELEHVDPYAPEYLNTYRRIQTVVLVRTGDERRMSTLIDFTAMADKAVPLNRPDLRSDSEIDAIRVSLHDAAQFVSDVQKREEEKRPPVYHIARKENHNHTGLYLRNSTGRGQDGDIYYPASEDEYMAEVVKVDKYTCSRRLIEVAKDAAANRGAEDPKMIEGGSQIDMEVFHCGWTCSVYTGNVSPRVILK